VKPRKPTNRNRLAALASNLAGFRKNSQQQFRFKLSIFDQSPLGREVETVGFGECLQEFEADTRPWVALRLM